MSDSEAAATPDKKKPKRKKLLVVVAAVLLLVLLGGGGAFFFLKKPAGGDEDEAHAESVQAPDPKAVPTFLPLDNMIVNLADPGGEKFAQIGITLEVEDAKAADRIKVFMPSIRSGILVLVSQRTSEELLGREGKEKLAADVLAEVGRPLGIVPAGEAAKAPAKPAKAKAADAEDDEEPQPKAKKKSAPKGPPNPVKKVLFSSFIVQ